MTASDFLSKTFHDLVIWSAKKKKKTRVKLTRHLFVLNIKYILMIFCKICFTKIGNLPKHLKNIKKPVISNI